jgi:hypothetical protein
VYDVSHPVGTVTAYCAGLYSGCSYGGGYNVNSGNGSWLWTFIGTGTAAGGPGFNGTPMQGWGCGIATSLNGPTAAVAMQSCPCVSSTCGQNGCPACTCDCASGYKCCSGTCILNGSTCTTPIVLDAFNEGYHLTSLNNGVEFRVLPGGPLQQMSWTDANWRNSWLALDRNDNGTIDDFTELFGNYTAQPPSNDPNGFLALAVFDVPANGGNGNGVIDPGDSVYANLRVWIDANHNGYSEPNELHTLQELGIFKIGLTYRDTPFVDQYGNRFRYKGSFWDQAGTEHDACYDVFLIVQAN